MFLFDIPNINTQIYDIETYPNVFTFTAKCADNNRIAYFEISDLQNDLELLVEFIEECQRTNSEWVGFNNIGFDYPVIHFIYQNRTNPALNAEVIYNKAMSIINAHPNAKFAHLVWESDWLIPQIDLYKIHHFDNVARATSLKMLEFNMRMDNIEDLPFEVNTKLTPVQIKTLREYNIHDVDATLKFFNETKSMIHFRRELTARYGKNFLNHNDTKIGKDYFIMELEKAHQGCCYKKVNGKKEIQQTKRESININDVILPLIKFNNPEFNRILDFFRSQTITETKGTFKNVSCTVNGFQYDFGVGGIHGSLDSSIVRSNQELMVLDIDVKSYYPNIAIANRLHPAHLGELFCDLYKGMYEERVQAQREGNKDKSAMLKLALNGVYGDSNNVYSPFYDPQYTMSITINGQLLLCMLADALSNHYSVEMIQINTDGLTVRFPRFLHDWVKSVCSWWEDRTNLTLEFAEYKAMFIRDVNNYLAVYTDNNIKRKGAYEYELDWSKNHSALVVPKAVEAYLVDGIDIPEFIHSHEDVYDFFLRYKVPRSTTMEWGGKKVANIVRYIISNQGERLEKVMPPAGPLGEFKRANNLTDAYFNQIKEEVGDQWDERIHTKNKSVYEERRTGINTGWVVEIWNRVPEFIKPDWIESNGNDGADIEEYNDFMKNINYEWYIQEAEKLIQLKEV